MRRLQASEVPPPKMLSAPKGRGHVVIRVPVSVLAKAAQWWVWDEGQPYAYVQRDEAGQVLAIWESPACLAAQAGARMLGLSMLTDAAGVAVADSAMPGGRIEQVEIVAP